MSKQAHDLDQGEVGAELDGVEGVAWRRHPGNVLASNSKRWYGNKCFKFEAHATRESEGTHHEGSAFPRVRRRRRPPLRGRGAARTRRRRGADPGRRDVVQPGRRRDPGRVPSRTVPCDAAPHPGIDVAGTVDALGDGVSGVQIGDDVIGVLPMVADGASAEYVVAPAEILAPAPKSISLAEAAAMPMVALTAWQALFDDAGLTAGQRVLINGAGGAVGGYAVQLAKNAGAHVIATASARSSEQVRTAGADEVIDHTSTEVTAAVSQPVDLLLNLAPITAERLVALVALVPSGGVVVNTVPTIPTPSDDERGVRAVSVFVRSDADQLSRLARMVDDGEVRVDVTERVPLAELPTIHAKAARGTLHGRVIVLPAAV